MGKSKKIEDAQKDNKEFQNYLAEIKGQLKSIAEAESKDFKEKIAEFYDERKLEYVVLAEGEKYDYRFATEIGLITLKEQIEKMVDALFGIATLKEPEKPRQEVINSTENGEVKVNITSEVIASLKVLNIYKSLAATVTTNLLTEILGIFSTTLEVKNSHSYSAEAVAPGLRLHIDVYADSYVNEKVMNKESIVENYVRFQLIYSPRLAAIEGNMQTQIILESRKTNLARMMTTFEAKVVDMLSDMKVSMDTINIYLLRLEALKNLYRTAQKDISDMVTQYMQANSIQVAAFEMDSADEEQRRLVEKRQRLLEEVRNERLWTA